MTALTVFYSWQTDTPSKVNRNFIEDALERALKQLNADAEVINSPRDVVLDKDTKGVPGTPPIVETIFNKIDGCSVFIPDVTFVAKTKKRRPTPNANPKERRTTRTASARFTRNQRSFPGTVDTATSGANRNTTGGA